MQGGEERFLAKIISTVGSSLDLEEVLDSVVRLLSDGNVLAAVPGGEAPGNATPPAGGTPPEGGGATKPRDGRR